jgi:hypothetical protein
LTGHLALIAQALLQSLQERTASGQSDAAVHDVTRELRGRTVEGLLDGGDDVADRLLHRLPHLLGSQLDRLRQPGDEVAAADLGPHLFRQRRGRARLELDLLGGLGADRQFVALLAVADDRLVELVAADPDRLRDDDAAEADHRDLGGAAADVDDHRAGRLGDREAGADRGRHRLLDQVCLAGAGREAGLLHRPLLDSGHPRGNADDDPRVGEAAGVKRGDEVPQHLLGDLEVGDHAVFQRPDRGDRAGRAAEHPLCFDADGVDVAAERIDRDHRGLREDNSAPSHIDERVGGSQVDGHVAAAEADQTTEQAQFVAPWG